MPEMTRRSALKVIGWTVPVVLTVDVTRADAALRHSAPPRPPQPHEQTDTLPMGPPLPEGLPAVLAYTDGADYRLEAAAGAVALCAGFALIARGHEPRHLDG